MSSRSKRKTPPGSELTSASKRTKTTTSSAEDDTKSETVEQKLTKRIKQYPNDGKKRCLWSLMGGELDLLYHDHEWGRPVHDDNVLFEFLSLEGFQAGLSWSTILAKRDNFRVAFDKFDPRVVAKYPPAKVEELVNEPGIVRHRGKIQATIKNAQVFLEIQKEHGSFEAFVRKIASEKAGLSLPLVNNPESINFIPSKTALSDALSDELKRRGMKFVGSTIVYAFLQACGFVDDHEASCWVKKK